MKILDRYVALALLRGFALALVVLTLLISLGALVKELDDVGEGRYSVEDAVAVVGLTMPERMLDLVAVSALVGGIVGLGGLAAGHEILVMQTAGLSPLRFATIALKTSIPIILFIGAVSEYGMPPLSQEAARRKRIATRGPDAAITEHAIWFKDGNTIVRLGGVRDAHVLEDIQIFHFTSNDRLREVITAATGSIKNRDRWVLYDVRHDTPTTPISTSTIHEIPSPLSTSSLDLLTSPPELFSLTRLWRDTREGGPAADNADLHRHLWRRLSRPFLMAAMLLLAMPFALSRTATSKLGMRLALGAVTGVLAHIGVEAVAYLGTLVRMDPVVVAVAPVILTLLAATALLLRLR